MKITHGCMAALALCLAVSGPLEVSAKTFAYVTNANSGNVSAYVVDEATGALAALPGSPFAAGSTPLSVAADKDSRFLYVANDHSHDISAFAIDPVTGALTPIPGSPFATGIFPISVSTHPRGNFLYVTVSGQPGIIGYAINPWTGALSLLPESFFNGDGSIPQRLAFDPTGRFAYSAMPGGGHISAYVYEGSDGTLRDVRGSPFDALGASPANVAVDPTGKFAYVTNMNSADISAYRIDSSTGALTPLPTAPFQTGALPQGILVDPLGRYVYVANQLSHNVAGYGIDPVQGTLTGTAGSPFPSRWNPVAVAMDPAGRYLYAVNRGSGDVTAWSMDVTTGRLTLVPGSPFAAGANPLSIVVVTTQKDDTAPVTTADIWPMLNHYGWTKVDTTVTLTATDTAGGSGVKAIQYSSSGAQVEGPRVVAGNTVRVPISTEGVTTLSYFAIDNEGNEEAPNSLVVRLDKTPPVISGFPGPVCSIWPPNNKYVQVASVSAADAVAGVHPGSFIVDATVGDLQPSTSRVVEVGDQLVLYLQARKGETYIVRAMANDWAGNSTRLRTSCTIPHDQRKPEIVCPWCPPTGH